VTPFSIADFSDALTAYLIAHPVVLILMVPVCGYLIGVLLHGIINVVRRAWSLLNRVRGRVAVKWELYQIPSNVRQQDESNLRFIRHLREQDAEARRIHRLVRGASDPTKAA
jgi:hypothetical protein